MKKQNNVAIWCFAISDSEQRWLAYGNFCLENEIKKNSHSCPGAVTQRDDDDEKMTTGNCMALLNAILHNTNQLNFIFEMFFSLYFVLLLHIALNLFFFPLIMPPGCKSRHSQTHTAFVLPLKQIFLIKKRNNCVLSRFLVTFTAQAEICLTLLFWLKCLKSNNGNEKRRKKSVPVFMPRQ